MYLRTFCLLLAFALPALADDDLYAQLARNGDELAKRCSCTGCNCKNGQVCRATGVACKCQACKCVKKAEVERPRFPTWEQTAVTDAASVKPLVIFCGVAPREVKGAIACVNSDWPAGVYVAVYVPGNNTFNRWKMAPASTDEEMLAVTRPPQPAPPIYSMPVMRGGGGCSS